MNKFESLLSNCEKPITSIVKSTKEQKDAVMAQAGIKVIPVEKIPEGVNPAKEGWLTINEKEGCYEVTDHTTAQPDVHYFIAVNKTFTEFCAYLKEVNYCITPNKRILCDVGSMTAADYTRLNAFLDVIRYCLLDWYSTKRLLDDAAISAKKRKAVEGLLESKRSEVYTALKGIKIILGVDIKATPSDISWLAGKSITAKYRNSTDIKLGYKFDICGNMTLLSNIFKLFSAQSDADSKIEDAAKRIATKNKKALQAAVSELRALPEKSE